jgi:hypothetical protein
MTVHRHNQRPANTNHRAKGVRRLRQVLTVLIAAIVGLILGTWALDQYRLHRTIKELYADQHELAIAAVDQLLSRTAAQPSLLDNIIPAIQRLGLPAEDLAVFHLTIDPQLPKTFTDRLPMANDDDLVLLADLLRRAGRWRLNEQPIDILARREIHRFRHKQEPDAKLFALMAIAEFDPKKLSDEINRSIKLLVTNAVYEVDALVATEAVRTAAVILSDEEIKSFVTRVTQSRHPAARAQAVITAGLRPIAQYPKLFDIVAEDQDESVLQALAWALGRSDSPNAVPILEQLLDGPPAARRMALASLAKHQWNPSPESFQKWLTHEDPITRARAAYALPNPTAAGWDLDQFDEFLLNDDQPIVVRLAAYTCLAGWNDAPRGAAIWLSQKLSRALQSGPEIEAAVIIETAPALAGRSFLDALTDIAANDQLPPMLRYIAARSLISIDITAAHDALLQLLTIKDDTAAEWSAYTLAHAPNPPIDLLIQNLAADDPLTQGRSALSIACALTSNSRAIKANQDATKSDRENDGASTSDFHSKLNHDTSPKSRFPNEPSVPITTLIRPPSESAHQRPTSIPFTDWLRRKTNRSSPEFETHWQTHGYYFQARLLLGHQKSRETLEIFLINANVSRLALYATLLEVDDPTPIDLLLTENPTTDPLSFFTQARFIEIIGNTNPTAPTFHAYHDIEYRSYQLKRLRDWWRIESRLAPNQEQGR